MTEKEFWKLLEESWGRGRAQVMTGRLIESDDPVIAKTGEYFEGHSLLPADHAEIPLRTVKEMGSLLLRRESSVRTQEAILMILAHHPSKIALQALAEYVKKPDKGLEIFAQLALDECGMWN